MDFIRRLVIAVGIAIIIAVLFGSAISAFLDIDIGALVRTLLTFAVLGVVVDFIGFESKAAEAACGVAIAWVAAIPSLDSHARVMAGAPRKASLLDYLPSLPTAHPHDPFSQFDRFDPDFYTAPLYATTWVQVVVALGLIVLTVWLEAQRH